MQIRRDDLTGAEIQALLAAHLCNMHELSSPESMHALNLDGLRQPEVTFWSAWEGSELLGCGALKELDPQHGEIKSMRTVDAQRRRGVGRAMLEYVMSEARRRGYRRLSLETGSLPAFDQARRLYEQHGFRCCGPFAGYPLDPFSVFMTREL